ncbi:cutinase family protein [Nocardioides humilatus]|uniref:Cutinase family protein n=1 Tax=Nocardioides humilatus TaxID=2607660 RepID=A0A5B1L7F0_9ACTN|nr:cutinase family protein [Nocardioides humilatus]KAA1416465.1 cutinase family protein [Nocardioides humilatus]
MALRSFACAVVAALVVGFSPGPASSAEPVGDPSLVTTPSAAIAGESLTLSGLITPGVQRRVLLQRWAGTSWTQEASTLTDLEGGFSIVSKLRATTTYRAVAPRTVVAGTTYSMAVSPTAEVLALPQSGTLDLPTMSGGGEVVTATARFSPSRAGRAVTLQVYAGALGWQPIATGVESADGEASFPIATAEPGTVTYRALAAAAGGAKAVMTASARLKIAEPLSPAGESPAVVGHCGSIKVDTTWLSSSVHRLTCNVTVLPDATLTIEPGAVVKAPTSSWLAVGGTLQVDGTEASPVQLTSLKDDAIGGDTNGDADATAPAARDWYGIKVQAGGRARLAGTTLRYATVALDVADGSAAEIRGAILDSATGILGRATYVDATGVDWTGTATPLNGTWIDATPAGGWAVPEVPERSAPTSTAAPAECKDVLFIGVRGSGQLPQPGLDDSEYPTPDIGFASMWLVEQGFEDNYAGEVTPWALRYRAGGGTPSIATLLSDDYTSSFWGGVDALTQFIEAERVRCAEDPQQIVLAGYSQGAQVIHRYLSLQGVDDIAAAVLVSDPERNAADGALHAGGADPANPGIYTKLLAGSDLPEGAEDRIISVCHDGDVVCGATPGAVFAAHLGYYAVELRCVGRWAAAIVDAGGAQPMPSCGIPN